MPAYTVRVRRTTVTEETWELQSDDALDFEDAEDIVLGGKRPLGVTAEMTDSTDNDDNEVAEVLDFEFGEN